MSEYTLIDLPVKIKKSKINVVTYSPILNLVAIGRENGLVEIYDYSQDFFLLAKVIISNSYSIDGLKFMSISKNVKLFGITTYELFEIDICKNYVKQKLIFPSKKSARSLVQASDKIFIGFDGGYINVFEYISEITFLQTFHNATESITSLCYSKIFKNSLYAGCTGRLYKIDMTTQNADYFEIIKEKGKPKTEIWCMEFLGKYLCTGDSRGLINIWNAETFGNIRAFSTHKAPILCMSVINNCLYASGSEPVIVKLELNEDVVTETTKHHVAVGEVRSICTTENKLMFADSTGDLSVCDINSKYETRSIKQNVIEGPLNQIEILSFQPSETYIAFVGRAKSVLIYKISIGTKKEKLIQIIKSPNRNHLQAWSVSKSLDYFAYSTDTETVIDKMTVTINESISTVEFDSFSGSDNGKLILPAAYLLKFITVDNRQFLILVESCTQSVTSDNNSKILIYEIPPSSVPVLRTRILAKEENYFNAVHKISASENGRYFSFSTLDGMLFIYSLKRMAIVKKVARHVSSTIPRIVCMDFNDSSDRLVAIYSNRKIADMDLGEKLATKWTNLFNSHLRNEWLQLCPRSVQFTDKENFLVLVNRRLLVKIDMKKSPIVPIEAPLFRNRKVAQSIKSRGLRAEISSLKSKIFKTDTILLNWKGEDEEERKTFQKIKERYEKKLNKISEVSVDRKIETCFTWTLLNGNAIDFKAFIEEKNYLITVSVIEEEEVQTSYKKKQFGQ